MKKFGQWFKDLSRLGKFGFISAASLSGLMVLSAAAVPSTPSAPATQQDLQQVQPVMSTETETRTEVIAHTSRTVEDSDQDKGKTQVQIAGMNGEKVITDTITLRDGVEVSRTSSEEVTREPVEEVIIVGTYVAPTQQKSQCDPNYSGCVPIVSGDLDCPDIGFSVQVLGTDKHRFDGDGDGYGCESY